MILCFAVFPLIISAYLALSRFALAPGGFTLKFVGFLNFKKLLTGSQQYHLLGTWGTLGALHWLVLALGAARPPLWLARYFRSGRAGVLGIARPPRHRLGRLRAPPRDRGDLRARRRARARSSTRSSTSPSA